MDQNGVDHFTKERERLNELLLKHADQTMKRFISLDGQTYRAGALDSATKEMMGLVASLTLRCDDCIRYHLQRCHHEQVTTQALVECMDVALIVGGSIVIPHLRRAMEFWNALKEEE